MIVCECASVDGLAVMLTVQLILCPLANEELIKGGLGARGGERVLVPEEARLTSSIAATLGPILGGLLTDKASW